MVSTAHSPRMLLLCPPTGKEPSSPAILDPSVTPPSLSISSCGDFRQILCPWCDPTGLSKTSLPTQLRPPCSVKGRASHAHALLPYRRHPANVCSSFFVPWTLLALCLVKRIRRQGNIFGVISPLLSTPFSVWSLCAVRGGRTGTQQKVNLCEKSSRARACDIEGLSRSRQWRGGRKGEEGNPQTRAQLNRCTCTFPKWTRTSKYGPAVSVRTYIRIYTPIYVRFPLTYTPENP